MVALDSRQPFRDFVYSALGRKGTAMYVRASGKPVFDCTREFRGHHGTGTDVTAILRAQRAEETLRAIQAELAHVTRVHTFGELTAWIAHEVNQPIAAVRNDARAALNFLEKHPPRDTLPQWSCRPSIPGRHWPNQGWQSSPARSAGHGG